MVLFQLPANADPGGAGDGSSSQAPATQVEIWMELPALGYSLGNEAESGSTCSLALSKL